MAFTLISTLETPLAAGGIIVLLPVMGHVWFSSRVKFAAAVG